MRVVGPSAAGGRAAIGRRLEPLDPTERDLTERRGVDRPGADRRPRRRDAARASGLPVHRYRQSLGRDVLRVVQFASTPDQVTQQDRRVDRIVSSRPSAEMDRSRSAARRDLTVPAETASPAPPGLEAWRGIDRVRPSPTGALPRTSDWCGIDRARDAAGALRSSTVRLGYRRAKSSDGACPAATVLWTRSVARRAPTAMRSSRHFASGRVMTPERSIRRPNPHARTPRPTEGTVSLAHATTSSAMRCMAASDRADLSRRSRRGRAWPAPGRSRRCDRGPPGVRVRRSGRGRH